MNKEKLISDYIASQNLGVVATINRQGNPEAALVAITEIENLELVFGTYNTSRKYHNVMENSHVAVTLGHDVKEAITVQYEGIAEELSGDDLERCKDLHTQKNLRSRKHADKPEQRWFKIKPTWIRYADLASNPQVKFEIKF